ncbi:MAG: hypothetical protein JWO12_1886 [Frankiales bacterium]|nr:hypothetical protein [Frankiales bacterium]
MSEMSSGLRSLEMHERQAWLRERARRESGSVVQDRVLPWKLRRRHSS